MWVVKLGGSLADAPELKPWLAAIAGRGDAVVVPGGGPFADAVRVSQARWGFDDTTAHRMALLAMEQYAHLLAALEPRLLPAADPAAITDALARGRPPVWLPSAMALADPAIECSWSVTSDSLAAWLAARLAAERLLLVKSAPGPYPEGIGEMIEAGLVDAAFGEYCRTPVDVVAATAWPAWHGSAVQLPSRGRTPNGPCARERGRNSRADQPSRA